MASTAILLIILACLLPLPPRSTQELDDLIDIGACFPMPSGRDSVMRP